MHRDLLYLVNDNEEKSELLAIDAASGKEVWRVDRDEKSNWSTPFVWDSGLRTEIVTLGSGKVRSYDLDGKLLWWLKGMSSITIATPYADRGLLYISSGYIIAAEVSLLGIRSMVLGVGVADVAVSPVVRTNADGSGDGVGTARLPEGEPWPPAIRPRRSLFPTLSWPPRFPPDSHPAVCVPSRVIPHALKGRT